MGGILPRNSDNLFSFSRRSSSSLGSCVDPIELTFDTRSLFDRSMRSRSALVAASASPVELVSESFLVVSILVGGGIS